MNTDNAYQESLKRACDQIEQMQEEWRKNDPDFDSIMVYLHPQMPQVGSALSHETWPKITQIMYQMLKNVLKDNGLSKEQQGDPLHSATLH